MDQAAWLDQMHARIRDQIRSSGWSIQYIGGDTCSRPGCPCPQDDQPPFAYTVGLFGLGHPELLMIGIDPDTAAGVLDELAARIKDGDDLMPGIMVTFDDWPHRIVPETVPNPEDILIWANDYYRQPEGHSVPALQLTYDDTEGRFPWDDDYAAPHLQPRPGTFSG